MRYLIYSALQKNTTPIQAVDSYSTPLDSAQLQPHKTVVPSNEMVESRLPCGHLVTIKLPEGIASYLVNIKHNEYINFVFMLLHRFTKFSQQE